jgi:hypothetical protein
MGWAGVFTSLYGRKADFGGFVGFVEKRGLMGDFCNLLGIFLF